MEDIDVLFVENDEDIAELYSTLIEKTVGCTFKVVSSGEEALKLLTTTRFKIFILDINLGSNKLSGIDLSVEIRKQNPNAKIYAVTGFTYLFDAIDPSVAGFNEVLKKPNAILGIVNTIKKDLAI